MAGFFGLFNYEKEGPGISKNAPKKKTFVVFFETFFRNFWKFITINIVYVLLSLPLITSGLAAVGITNVTRNTARDKHSFGLSDFFETIKKNWKQALVVGIINNIVTGLLIFDIYFFYAFVEEGIPQTIGLGMVFAIILIFSIMKYYIWTLLITFKFSIKQIYLNSFRFVFANFMKNLGGFLLIILIYAGFIALPFILASIGVNQIIFISLFLEFALLTMVLPGFKYLLIQYIVFPPIKKYIIEPYYLEHPDEDIEKRRDLGLEIPEEESEDLDEDGDEDLVFND